MSAYVIVELSEVADPSLLKEYAALAHDTVVNHGGTYRVLRGSMEVKEGAWQPAPLVILEFPSMRGAQDWYDSSEYKPLIEMRNRAGKFNVVIVEGL